MYIEQNWLEGFKLAGELGFTGVIFIASFKLFGNHKLSTIVYAL